VKNQFSLQKINYSQMHFGLGPKITSMYIRALLVSGYILTPVKFAAELIGALALTEPDSP
jgi:hypothetical protein